jgi:hypothetical protein
MPALMLVGVTRDRISGVALCLGSRKKAAEGWGATGVNVERSMVAQSVWPY